MKSKGLEIGYLLLAVPLLLALVGCSRAHGDAAAEAPPPAKVVPDVDVNLLSVDHPEQFPLSAVTEHTATSRLVVTGAVTPDIARNVPVISLATGRVVAIHARLGDIVKKGQLLLTIRSDDVAGGFSDYRKAVSAEALTRTQLERVTDLYKHGANSLNDLQVAEDAENRAKIDLETTAEHLRLLGNDPDHPKVMVDIYAPVSGVITDQQVTNAAGVQALGASPFTISDLSYIWVVCDVYENDLANVHLDESAEIAVNAYPDQVIKGRISNIGAVLDPSIRTAKVRLEVRNPGMLRIGMFVTATFHGLKKETHTVIPATAILHLHDRDWVYVPTVDNKFRRVEVVSGEPVSSEMQEVVSGLKPGERVVTNALVLEHTVNQ
ncbi:MAG: efflux RND transporter periplasmic adaptor subunit [Acidobacteriia bacterium]|nr:efflux RND transporter periplasmic adaptor subunit [Terriglobia bacterium]